MHSELAATAPPNRNVDREAARRLASPLVQTARRRGGRASSLQSSLRDQERGTPRRATSYPHETLYRFRSRGAMYTQVEARNLAPVVAIHHVTVMKPHGQARLTTKVRRPRPITLERIGENLDSDPTVHKLVLRTPQEAARPSAHRLLQPVSAAEQLVTQPIY